MRAEILLKLKSCRPGPASHLERDGRDELMFCRCFMFKMSQSPRLGPWVAVRVSASGIAGLSPPGRAAIGQ